VVRESEIDSTGVNIERLAQVFMDMAEHSMCQPGRPGPMRVFPAVLARFGCLPQSEVAGIVFLVLIYVHPRASFHSGRIDLRKFPVLRKFRDAKINRAVNWCRSSLFFAGSQ